MSYDVQTSHLTSYRTSVECLYMSKYLGEFPVDIATHPVYSKYTPADWAMAFVERYGGIDGSHHKTWVLDQVARCLKGVPIVVVEARWSTGSKEYRISTSQELSETYKAWVQEMRGKYDPDSDSYEYDYDDGCAP